MLNFSMPELVLVLFIALVVFGPGKLPDVGKAMGKSLQEFRHASSEIKAQVVMIESKTEEKPTAEKK